LVEYSIEVEPFEAHFQQPTGLLEPTTKFIGAKNNNDKGTIAGSV